MPPLFLSTPLVLFAELEFPNFSLVCFISSCVVPSMYVYLSICVVPRCVYLFPNFLIINVSTFTKKKKSEFLSTYTFLKLKFLFSFSCVLTYFFATLITKKIIKIIYNFKLIIIELEA